MKKDKNNDNNLYLESRYGENKNKKMNLFNKIGIHNKNIAKKG